MAYEYRKFYIDGQWVDPAHPKEFKVINPATEEAAGVISMGGAADVDRAVAAARGAFDSFSQTTGDERRGLLETILKVYKKRYADVANAIRDEMGAPAKLANGSQAGIGVGHLSAMIDLLNQQLADVLDLGLSLPSIRDVVGVTPHLLAASGPRPPRRDEVLAIPRHRVADLGKRVGPVDEAGDRHCEPEIRIVDVRIAPVGPYPSRDAIVFSAHVAERIGD